MDHVIIFVSLIAAAAPVLAVLFFIWWVDRYDREPLGYVFAAFLWEASARLPCPYWGLKPA